jgi:hypothetical protein
MASAYVTNLLTRRATIATELAALVALNGSAGSKPNLTSTDGGTAVDHQGYKTALYAELKDIDTLLQSAFQIEPQINDNDPFEITTTVISYCCQT